MPIKRFELTSIDARRFSKHDEKPKNIRIDHNSKVTMMRSISNEEAIIDFRFTANYSGMGLIKIEGSILYGGNVNTLVEQWNKQENMPNEIAHEIHTAIMNNCIPEAMMLARDIRLPPPLPMPKVNIQTQKKKGSEPGGYA